MIVLNVLKRFQYWASDGIRWTDWFKWNSNLKEKWQVKNKLLCEYKDEDICTDS